MQLNTSIKPASKKDAFAMIKSAFEIAGDNGASLPTEQLEALYKYFMPALPKAVKKDWQWISRAVGKRDFRPTMNWLYSDGSRLMATDSHRLHIIPSTMTKGYYHPKTLDSIDLDAVYPDIDRVIGNRGDFEPLHHFPMTELKTFKSMELVKLGNNWFQLPYIVSALNGRDDWVVSVQDNSPMIGQTDDGWQFAVMPIRA